MTSTRFPRTKHSFALTIREALPTVTVMTACFSPIALHQNSSAEFRDFRENRTNSCPGAVGPSEAKLALANCLQSQIGSKTPEGIRNLAVINACNHGGTPC